MATDRAQRRVRRGVALEAPGVEHLRDDEDVGKRHAAAEHVAAVAAGVLHLLLEGGQFKAPTLRNIAVTAPYMHDGRLPSLESVIDHYSKGGVHSPKQDELIRGFPLTPRDRADLIAFLQSLTDEAFLHNPRYSNPWH